MNYLENCYFKFKDEFGGTASKINPPWNHLSLCFTLTHCSVDYYSCAVYRNCIPTGKLCDGEFDCILGDDELDCGNSFLMREIYLGKNSSFS